MVASALEYVPNVEAYQSSQATACSVVVVVVTMMDVYSELANLAINTPPISPLSACSVQKGTNVADPRPVSPHPS